MATNKKAVLYELILMQWHRMKMTFKLGSFLVEPYFIDIFSDWQIIHVFSIGLSYLFLNTSKVLKPPSCKKRQKNPHQYTGWGNKGPLKALNDNKLIFNN